MKKLFKLLITVALLFISWSSFVNAANFWTCEESFCRTVGYASSDEACEAYYSKPCYDNSYCDNRCGNEGSPIGGGRVAYYYCRDYYDSGWRSECYNTRDYTSPEDCQFNTGRTCYTSNNCNGMCSDPGKSLTTYYYCDGGGCRVAWKRYYTPYDCSYDNGNKTCYTDSNCNNQCSVSSGQDYWACDSTYGCRAQGKFASTQACKTAIGKECYTNNTCDNQCGSRSFDTCNNYSGGCEAVPRTYTSVTHCNSQLGITCYERGTNCNNQCYSKWWYCFGTSCQQTERAYRDSTDCANDIGKVCYQNNNCNNSCSSSGSVTVGSGGSSGGSTGGSWGGGSGGGTGGGSTGGGSGSNTSSCLAEARPATNITGLVFDYSFQMNGFVNGGGFYKFNLYSGKKVNGNKIGEYQVYPVYPPNDMRVSQKVSGLSIRNEYCYTVSVYSGSTYQLLCESSEYCLPATPPPASSAGYSCNKSTGFCAWVSTGAQYSTLNQCSSNCTADGSGYNCNQSTGTCSYVSFGAQYSTNSLCSSNCSPATGNLSAQTNPATNITYNSARFNGAIISRGGYTNIQYWFRYYKVSDGIWKATAIYNAGSYNSFGVPVNGLEANTDYCYHVVIQATGTTKQAQGELVCFKTPAIISGYNCINGFCQASTQGNADYSTQAQCNQYCAPEIRGYNCISGTCVGTYDYFFDYANQNDCNTGCVSGPGWVCNPNGTCSAVLSGAHYNSESVCDTNCNPLTPNGYNCVLGTCQPSYDYFSDYPTQQTCSANCSNSARWSCQTNGTCIQVASGGDYTTQSSCTQYCQAHQETILVRTDPASAVNQDSARLNGTLVDNGGRPDLEYFFRYHENGSSTWITTPVVPISSEGSMFSNISNLKPNTQYCYYVAVRIIGQGTEHRGEELCFTTSPLANLGIPILIYPINDEIVNTTLINFDWTDVAGAQIYEIWETFENDPSTESVYYSDVSNLTAEVLEIGRHRWRVRVCNGVSNIRPRTGGYGIVFDGTPNCGPWTEEETFRIANNNGIQCVYETIANGTSVDVLMNIDLSPCSMNVSFTDAIQESIVIQAGTQLRVGDRVYMNINDPSGDWTVGANSTIRHPIAWIANAQTAFSSATPISPTYPFTSHLFDPNFGIDEYQTFNVGVAATNPVIQNPDIISTNVSGNFSIQRVSPGKYLIVVLSEGTGNISLNVDDIFSYATVNGEVCGSGFMPGCSRSFNFNLQGTIPDEDVPGGGGITTSTVPGGTDHSYTTSTCVEVRINDDGIKEIINNGSCNTPINAVIYDIGRNEVLGRDAVLRIENYTDNSGKNTAPKISNLRNNNPNWCESQSYRLEWDYVDSENDPQARYIITIYDQDGLEVEKKEIQSASSGYQFSLVNRYGKNYEWEVEVWDSRGLSTKSAERAQITGIPKHQYPSPLFKHQEVQLGANDVEYKIWFIDDSKSYGGSNISKYEWDFDGDGKWDKIADDQKEIQDMIDNPETELLYIYDPDNYQETILRITDSDGYVCQYLRNVIPEDFKYEDSPVQNLN